MLRRAAEGGDESAAATCDQLLSEAKAREEEALFKLRALASGGDSRARAVLEQHEAERAAVTARAGATLIRSLRVVDPAVWTQPPVNNREVA